MKKTCIYIGRKLVIFLLSIFLLSLITFYIARLAPGDPLVSYYGDRVEKMSPEERDQAEEKLGLKEPISVQYVKWLKRVAHGDFGISWKYKTDVLEVIKGRLGKYAASWRHRFCTDLCAGSASGDFLRLEGGEPL